MNKDTMFQVELTQRLIKRVSEKLDDFTSAGVHKVFEDRETAVAIKNIIAYAKSLSFLEESE